MPTTNNQEATSSNLHAAATVEFVEIVRIFGPFVRDTDVRRTKPIIRTKEALEMLPFVRVRTCAISSLDHSPNSRRDNYNELLLLSLYVICNWCY